MAKSEYEPVPVPLEVLLNVRPFGDALPEVTLRAILAQHFEPEEWKKINTSQVLTPELQNEFIEIAFQAFEPNLASDGTTIIGYQTDIVGLEKWINYTKSVASKKP